MLTCRRCGQKHEEEMFPPHVHSRSGRVSVCRDCWGGSGYVDEDTKESTPPMSSTRLKRIHGLSAVEVNVAEEAAERVIAYRTKDDDNVDRGMGWSGVSAEDVVDAELADASVRRRARVLAVALRLADEEMGSARKDAA